MQADDGTASYRFTLQPNRPLGNPALLTLMALVGLVSGAVGTGFVLLGAWPVTGFLGLDVVGLALALRWAQRQARRHEVIELAPAALVVRRVGVDGAVAEERLPPHWARIDLEDVPGRTGILSLAAHGRRIEVGSFLGYDEKRELAQALGTALAAVRG